MTAAPVLLSVDGPAATITLNRPAARNAISTELLVRLGAAMTAVEADDSVRVAVLTGADPAFCAGLDLKELGEAGSGLHTAVMSASRTHAPWPPISKPVIAAVNGPAVTGGLELVLNCDVIICSDRASFADTHARVGVLPGWGLTVLLPMAVGRSRARQLSLTGDVLDAAAALTAGLVSEVVPHERLMARAHAIASSVASNDPRAVRALLASYRGVEDEFVAGGYDVEERAAHEWNSSDLDLAASSRTRGELTRRGSQQLGRS